MWWVAVCVLSNRACHFAPTRPQRPCTHGSATAHNIVGWFFYPNSEKKSFPKIRVHGLNFALNAESWSYRSGSADAIAINSVLFFFCLRLSLCALFGCRIP